MRPPLRWIACLVLLAAATGLWAAPTRPNIVFIICDDLRYDYLGCTGHPSAKTPHIDRIAAEGMNFRNFFVASPLCSPSRASFLTGQYPHTHKIINNDKLGLTEISHTLYTWPRALREAGYTTGFIGKWHMGLDDSRRPGWDHWISFKGQGLYIDPVVNINGSELQLTGYTTDLLNHWAVEFIDKNAGREKPFVLYLSHKAVHNPYIPAERHESLYQDVKYAPPSSAQDDHAGKPVMTRPLAKQDPLALEGVAPEPGEPRRGRGRTPEAVIRDQLRCIAAVDDGVAQIFQALQRHNQLDNTVIIFTGDNGYLMGEHKLMDEKRWAYEESIRVPFLVRYPPLVPAGVETKAQVVSVDVAATIYDLTGVKPLIEQEGQSFLAVLRNPKAPGRAVAYSEYHVEKVAPRVPHWQMARTDTWKLIHFPELTGMDELYNLADDPYEMHNLIAESSAAKTVEDLRRQIDARQPKRRNRE